ncbi:MAG: hypothetical protein HC919_11370 [Oscillatoriales cyanobacterium SM2_2_1]|nr:hypothetical protein [Oscillatoriales cyanobacterium SM2_2_1]
MAKVLEQESVITSDACGWPEAEQVIARYAFDLAYQRETATILQSVRQTTQNLDDLNTAWQLHDFLSARRHDLDGKYDFRLSSLIFVLARLVKEGWLEVGDLQGLTADKVAKITSLSRMLP